MPMTPAQLAALKAAILAETDPTFVAYRTGGETVRMAEFYNAEANPTHLVWRTEVPVSNILDAINFALYTPADAIDNTATYSNRLLAIQTKQMNLQTMLFGREKLDASKANIRAGLRDAVVAVPAGTAGAAVSPGGASGVTVLNACTRKASRGEKLFATTSAQTGSVTAFLMEFEGFISSDVIVQALYN